MFHILIIYSLYNKEFIRYLISLDGEVVLANWGITVPERDFIYEYFSGYIYQKLELMYQNSFLRHNFEIKEDRFVVLCHLHNLNQDKIYKFMFVLLLNDSSWYISCVCFMSEYFLFVTSSLTPVYMEGWSFAICLTVFRATITRESDIGSLRPVGLIYSNLLSIDSWLNLIDPSTNIISSQNSEQGYRTKLKILLEGVFK